MIAVCISIGIGGREIKELQEFKAIDFPTAITTLPGEDLRKEFFIQEKLLAAYQKENERLSSLIKEKENALVAVQADFYDKQEGLNKELLRLKNENSSVNKEFIKRKGAENIRAEIETDVKLRALQDKIRDMEHQTNERENQFRKTIHLLKEENSKIENEKKLLQSRNVQTLEQELVSYKQEILELKEKIRWYQDGQGVIGKLQNKIDVLTRQQDHVRNQLLLKGIPGNFIEDIFDGRPSHLVWKGNNSSAISRNDDFRIKFVALLLYSKLSDFFFFF